MSKQSRFGKIFPALLIVLLVAGLRVWYSLDSSPAVLVAIVFISLIILGLKKVFSDETEHFSTQEETPAPPPSPRRSRITFNYNGQSFDGLETMPFSVLREYLVDLEQSAQAFPQSFTQKLMILGRVDLAGDFEASLLSYNMGRLTKDELKPVIREIIDRLEAGVVYSPSVTARRPDLLVDFTHEGVTYSRLNNIPPHLRDQYKKELERILLEDPARFDDLLKKHWLVKTLAELNETRRLRSLDLITQGEFEAAIPQMLSKLAD